MNTNKMLMFAIGVLGLLAVLWFNFLVELPLMSYFVVMPLVILPSLFLLLQGLSKGESGSNQ